MVASLEEVLNTSEMEVYREQCSSLEVHSVHMSFVVVHSFVEWHHIARYAGHPPSVAYASLQFIIA